MRLQLRLQRLQAMREAGARLIGRDRVGRDVFLRGAPEGLKVVRRSAWQADLYDLIAAYGIVRARTEPAVHVDRAAAGDDARRGDPPARADDRGAARMDRARGLPARDAGRASSAGRRWPRASSRRSSWRGWARSSCEQKGGVRAALREGGMSELSDAVRAVEATLFAAEEPLSAGRDRRSMSASGVDVAAALAELEAPLCRARRRAGRARRALAFPDRRRPRPYPAPRARGEPQALAAPRSRRWRSSPITSRSAAPRSRRSAACRSRKGTLDVLMEAGWVRPGRAARGARAAAHLCDDAGLPYPFRAKEPARPARDRRSQGGGPARSGRCRARAAGAGRRGRGRGRGRTGN